MQDVDFELVYEPGKDAADPMDYLSRHPLPVSEKDDTEKTIKMIVNNEHGVVMKSIKEATLKDEILQDVIKRMKQNDWERHKNRTEVKPYYLVRHELFLVKGLVLRCRQIVIPEKLQKQVIKAAHSMGHFGMTRTKQMLRAKYWFPRLNSMVEETVSRCYQCQVTTAEHKQEPVKPSEIPETVWHTLSADFGGPYPDGHYNLVVIDKRTRFPVVEQTTSTSCRVTCDRLRNIFATYGIPEKLETDNGPPFNSAELKKFAEEMGFQHHRLTPEHPRANGEAERFMKVLNKSEQIAHCEGEASNYSIQYMLMGYRSTPHPATGYSPYEALMKRTVRTKLDYKSFSVRRNDRKIEREITNRDRIYKKKWDKYHRHPLVIKHHFTIGDKVLLRKRKQNKWSTAYEKEYYVIVEICGSTVKARRKSDGRTVNRDASKFKLLRESAENWRERLLCAPDRSHQGPPSTVEVASQDGKDDQRLEESREEELNQEQDGSQRQNTETQQEHQRETRQERQREEPQRRELPRRTRRLPSKFKDYILDFKKK